VASTIHQTLVPGAAPTAAPEAAPIAPASASSLHPEMIGVSGGGDNHELQAGPSVASAPSINHFIEFTDDDTEAGPSELCSPLHPRRFKSPLLPASSSTSV